jgi:CRP/FNR family cyclic AMP-dependent transcriptional regulator
MSFSACGKQDKVHPGALGDVWRKALMPMEVKSKRETLAESPLFHNVLPVELSLLADLVTVHEHRSGEILFNEGDVGDALYVLAEGSVEILQKSATGTPFAVATLSSPQFFGEMSLIDKEVRSATVRAASDVTVLKLTNENLHVFAKNYRNGFTWIVVNIARVLSARLRETNKRLAAKM